MKNELARIGKIFGIYEKLCLSNFDSRIITGGEKRKNRKLTDFYVSFRVQPL
jgi:hypothetical protein